MNLLTEPFAKKIVLLIKYIAAEHDIPYGGDEMLFEILHFDWFNIPPVEIAKLSIEVADRAFGNNKTSLRRLLYDKGNTPPADSVQQGSAPRSATGNQSAGTPYFISTQCYPAGTGGRISFAAQVC